MNGKIIKLSTLLGIYEPIFYFLLITTLSLVRSDYHLQKNYVSELSGRDVANRKYINLSSFILLGIVVILYSYTLQENVRKHKLSKPAKIFLIISGASLILLGLVPADGKTPTKYGHWHRWLTGPVAVGMPLAIFCYSIIFKKDKRWKKIWPGLSLLFGSVMVVTDVLLLKKKPQKYLGLVQRVGMGLALFWIFATSGKIYSLKHN